MTTLTYLCIAYTAWRLSKMVFFIIKGIRNAESPWIDVGRLGSGTGGGH